MNEPNAAPEARKPRRKGEEGFTLIELLIVCAIIGIIANLAIPGLYASMYKAKAARIVEDYNTLRLTAHQYYVDYGHWPADQGPGVEPPELLSSLGSRLNWTHEDYTYDWELWIDGSGNPTEPATGVLVGFSIVTSDPALTDSLRKVFKGTIIDTIPNHTTFVIDPYNG